jgi:hypothetical protein
MTKHKSATGGNSKAGNVSSVDKPGPVRPWTDEEMAEAKPLPIPTVDPTAWVGVASVSHTGIGKTKAAGRPENDDEVGSDNKRGGDR